MAKSRCTTAPSASLVTYPNEPITTNSAPRAFGDRPAMRDGRSEPAAISAESVSSPAHRRIFEIESSRPPGRLERSQPLRWA